MAESDFDLEDVTTGLTMSMVGEILGARKGVNVRDKLGEARAVARGVIVGDIVRVRSVSRM